MWICALYLLCSRVCKVGARVYFSIEDGLLLMISIPGYLPSLTTYSCACADDSYGWASCEYTTDSLYNHSSDIVMHIAEITLRQMGRIVCVDLFMIIIPMFASSYYIINRCLYILIGIGMDDSDEADDHADRDDTHNMDSHQHNFYYNAKMLSIGIVITTISIFYALSHIANHNTNQSPSIISNSS